MSLVRNALSLGACLAILACGSEPRSRLILGGEGKAAALGMRELTSAQSRALQGEITSAGAPCELLERAYLRQLQEGQFETWDVRCADGNYSVNLFADGSAADVQRCFAWSWRGCTDPYSSRRFYREPDRREPTGQLNPELGKLLEEMSAKNGKAEKAD